MTMIEKVAWEIARGSNHVLCIDDCRFIARTVIKTMREPNERMIIAIPQKLGQRIYTKEIWQLTVQDWTDVWQAMIDVALTEEKKANTVTSP